MKKKYKNPAKLAIQSSKKSPLLEQELLFSIYLCTNLKKKLAFLCIEIIINIRFLYYDLQKK